MPREPKPKPSLDTARLDRLQSVLSVEPPTIRQPAAFDPVIVPPPQPAPKQPIVPDALSPLRTESAFGEPVISSTAATFDPVAFPPIRSSAPLEPALGDLSLTSRPPAIPMTSPLPTTQPLVGTETETDGWSGVSGLLTAISNGIEALVKAGGSHYEAPAFSSEHPQRAQRENR